MKTYELGLIVGKFYPFHKGHEYLINTGLAHCDSLVVMVVSNRRLERISAETRAGWISETFPELDVRVIYDIGHDDDSKKWADYTVELLGRAPDAVFTSETYGATWAKELGCKHVQVDLPRSTFPISGTMVRSDPLHHWDMLPAATKRYFAQRVVLIGAESTGKSTLAEMLAKHYKTNWTHEYGRFYTELRRHNDTSSGNAQKGITLAWQEHDFVNIARTQSLIEDQLAETANKILTCDTDSFATHIWHYRYTKRWSNQVREIAKLSKPLMYLVTPPDIPFTQDGTRDGEHIRKEMHTWVVGALRKAGKPYHIVSGGGDVQARLDDAIKAIDSAQAKWIKTKGWANQ